MTSRSGDLDWHSLAAFVAHYAPGTSDPMELPVDRLLAVAHATSALLVRNAEAQTQSMRRIR
jgi:hypothetical protein